MSLYAIRVGTRWVEVREAKRKPKRVVTTVTRPITVEKLVRTRTQEGHLAYVPQSQQKPLTITQVVHEGGKVVKVVSYARFLQHSGVRLTPDQSALIPARDAFHAYFCTFKKCAT